MLKFVFEMETGDPDDFLTLLWLLGRRDVDLKAVVVTPGTPDQVGLVRHGLSWFESEAAVGAFNLDHPKACVSQWHYRAYGEIPPSQDAEPGGEVLLRCCDDETTLLSGAPPKNLGEALRLNDERGGGEFRLGRWVAQGGFAGEGVVASEQQLEKFRGRVTCPTYNLNGAPAAALAGLASPLIATRRFVSKNVCHAVYYDRAMHDAFAKVCHQSRAHALIWKGMDHYLGKRPEGKKFHDPLAACCAIDEAIGDWAEVELYRERGEWGARLATGSGTWIITGYDPQRFVSTLLACDA